MWGFLGVLKVEGPGQERGAWPGIPQTLAELLCAWQRAGPRGQGGKQEDTGRIADSSFIYCGIAWGGLKLREV